MTLLFPSSNPSPLSRHYNGEHNCGPQQTTKILLGASEEIR